MKAILFAVTVYVVAVCAYAQGTPGMGWLEGVVVDEKGKAIDSYIEIKRSDGTNQKKVSSNPGNGGFYELSDLKPGLYEVRAHGNFTGEYRPVRIFGVVVEANKRTHLKVVRREGREIEEIGNPNVVTEKAVLITYELNRLRKDNEHTKKELDDLKRQVQELKERQIIRNK